MTRRPSSQGADSAVRRLRHVRWSMTLFFALTTISCLVVLGAVAFDANQQARVRQSDQQLAATAVRLAASARYASNGFRFDRDEPPQFPPGDEPAAYLDDHGIELANPNQDALPRDAVLERLLARGYESGLTAYTTAPGPQGVPYRWVAVPMAGDGEAVVVVGAAAADPQEGGRFLTVLITTVIGLALLAALSGHLLSGVAMRPALQGLVRQEQFLREAAHELRTPLAALQMALQTARSSSGRESSRAVDRAARRVEELGRMVSWLLLRARTEAGSTAVDLRPLRLDQLVDVAVDELGDTDRVACELSPSIVTGNAELIVQAVRNLVENALRHTVGQVRVVVDDGVLTVIDEGSATPGELRDPTLSAGVGSGLAIVRWIAEVHHTRLRLDAIESGGSRASVRFGTSRTRPAGDTVGQRIPRS